MTKTVIASLAVLALCAGTSAEAKVLKQTTSIHAGYWFEMGDDSKASGQHDETNLIVAHKTVADWGEISARGKFENLLFTQDSVNGSEGNIAFKGFSTLYYNLDLAELKLWYDLTTISNKAIARTHNYVGVAKSAKFGKLGVKLGIAADYMFGHSSRGKFDGIGAYATKLNLSYPLTQQLRLSAMGQYRFDIDQQAQQIWKWQDHGHHLMVGAKYRFNRDWDMALAYHNFESWGGYNEGGNSVVMTVGYTF